MKIENKYGGETKFIDVEYGGCFVYEGITGGKYFMKLSSDEGPINAVGLANGDPKYFYQNDIVTPIEVRLVIE